MNRLWPVALFFIFSLILPNILFAQLDKPATATLFIRVSEANSDAHRQQLRETIENKKKQISKTQLQIDDLRSKENAFPQYLVDGKNIDETVGQQVRIRIAQLQEELASQMALRKRVEQAISHGGEAANGMVWELQNSGLSEVEKRGGGENQFAKQLTELRDQKTILEQQFGEEHPSLRALRSKIEKLERKSAEAKQAETKPKKRSGGDSQLAKQLAELRVQKSNLVHHFGSVHPEVKAVTSLIEELESRSATELKQDDGPKPQQSSEEVLKDFLKRTDASIEKNKASIKDLEQKVAKHDKAATIIVEANQEIDQMVDQLSESAAELELVERKLKNINDSSSELSFLFFKNLFSEAHLRRFAQKHRKTIGAKDDQSVKELIKNVELKPDELGQEYIYRLSVRNDSPVVEKATLYLLVQDIEAIAKDNKNNPARKRLDAIESEHDEVLKLLAAVDTNLQTVSDKAKEFQLQQKKERYSQRLQILKDSIPKWQKKASRAPDVELDVMSRGWDIEGDQEQSEYDKLRKQNADFPDLSNSAD